MMSFIWLSFIILSIVIGGINGKINNVTLSIVESAKTAVTISLSLIGIMAFWLGVMKLAEESGIVAAISIAVKPITRWLFPKIPYDDPAIGNMAMNFTANMLGVTNAATPIGIKAMKDLQNLNPKKDTASNAMCTFLAVNTAGFQLIPASIIAVLAATGSDNPTEIIGPTLFATSCAMITAIIAVKVLERFTSNRGEN